MRAFSGAGLYCTADQLYVGMSMTEDSYVVESVVRGYHVYEDTLGLLKPARKRNSHYPYTVAVTIMLAGQS